MWNSIENFIEVYKFLCGKYFGRNVICRNRRALRPDHYNRRSVFANNDDGLPVPEPTRIGEVMRMMTDRRNL